MEMSCDFNQKGKKVSLFGNVRWQGPKADANISNKLQLQNRSSTFIHKTKSLLPATSILSRTPMAYNTTASLAKLTCKDYVDFCKCQHRFGRFFWLKMTPKTWMYNSKFSRKMTTKRSDWYKLLQWEGQDLTSLCGWRISLPLQQKIFQNAKTSL